MPFQETTTTESSDSPAITIKQVILRFQNGFVYLRKRWLVIVLGGILGAAIGVGYAFLQKFQYYAAISFALEDDKATSGGLGGALGLASQFGIDLGTSGGGAFTGGNLIELMKSRKIVELALLNPVAGSTDQFSLADSYLRFNGYTEKWAKDPKMAKLRLPANVERSSFTLQQDSIMAMLYQKIVDDHLSVNQKDKKISILYVGVKSENEAFSKQFCEAIVKEVSDFYIETKSKKAKMNVLILERQADSIRTALNSAISNVATANDNTFNLNPAMNINRVPSTKRQIDVQANTAILTQLVTNLELARIGLRKETPLIQMIDKPILPLHKEKIRKLKGLIMGGITGAFFIIFYLVVGKVWKRITMDI
jgi:hypothetical protein